MSYRNPTHPTALYAALILVIGLTILVTGVITSHAVGPTIVIGTATTLFGAITTAATGRRAVHDHIRAQIEQNDSAALAREIIRHDLQYFTAPHADDGTIVELEARRAPRENTT